MKLLERLFKRKQQQRPTPVAWDRERDDPLDVNLLMAGPVARYQTGDYRPQYRSER